jgi:aminoglycoside 6'-N-acetyltransferase
MTEQATPPDVTLSRYEMTESTYRFRTFTHADLPMVAGWLRSPEVARWWGAPETQELLVTEDLNEPLMRQWIVEHWNTPFAYAQAYDAHAWPQNHLTHLAVGSMVIDAFVGEPEMLGRGHGSRFLRLLAQALVAEGAPTVAIDPVTDNWRARRAYAAAGFIEEQEFETTDGRVALMLFRGRATADIDT